MKIALFLIFAAIGLSENFAQETERLIDEFPKPNCEETSLRLDNFIIHLSNDPTKYGLVIVHGRKDDLRLSLVYEAIFKGYLTKRGFNLTA